MKRIALLFVYAYVNVYNFVENWGWLLWAISLSSVYKAVYELPHWSLRVAAVLILLVVGPVALFAMGTQKDPEELKDLRDECRPFVKFVGLHETEKSIYPTPVRKRRQKRAVNGN